MASSQASPARANASAAAVQAYIDAADRNESRLADTALHLAIAEATHNPVLVGMSQDLRAKITLNLGATKVSFQTQADAPSCMDCGSIMVRNGSCYKCLNCGSTSGCS